MKKIISLLLAISLSSCTASLQTISLNHRKYDGLKKEILKKDLGESLIIAGTEEYTDGINLENSINHIFKKNGYKSEFNLNKNDNLYLSGKDGNNSIYLSENSINKSNYTETQGVAINKTTNKKYIVLKMKYHNKPPYLLYNEFDFSHSISEYVNKDCNKCLKKELIYNGKSDNTIKVIYREFIDNMARPAFTQNLNYDLSEGDIISFKGCKIKVLNAKNIGIEYKILSSFNE